MEKENMTALNADELAAVTGGTFEGKGSGEKTYDPAVCDAVTEYTNRCKDCNRYRWLHAGDAFHHHCMQGRFSYAVYKPQAPIPPMECPLPPVDCPLPPMESP